MSETGVAGYAPVKTPTLNTDRNKPLHELSYKELQNMCMGFNLPANLKHSQMLIMLQARSAGDETTVHRILTDYREQRCRRRPRNDVPPATHPGKTEHKAKRRRSLTENRHEDYRCTSPQTGSGHLWTSQLPPESRAQTGDGGEREDSGKHLKADGTSGLETMKLVMEATATRRDVSAPELSLHRTHPLLLTMLQERPGPSTTETLCSPLACVMNISFPQNFCGKHQTRPPMYTDSYLPAATPTPQGGLLKSLLTDPGVDSSRLHELNQPSSYEPVEQAEDLSMGRRTVTQSPIFPPSCQFQTPQLFCPERVSSQFNHCGTSENSSSLILSDVIPRDQGKETEVVTKHLDKDLPACLELVLNMKSGFFSTGTAMPKFLKAATTSTYQCYIAPVCSNSMTGLPEGAGETFEKERQVTEPDLPGASDDPWWCPQQVPSFPEFRHNNQLSYPLIYSYVASTEEQLRQQNEERRGNVNVDWVPNVQHRPQAMSSPNETSQIIDSGNFLPTISEHPQLDDAVLDIINGQQNLHLSDLGSCRYQINGCKKAGLKQADLQRHENLCVFQTAECYNRCAWRGHLKHLVTHLRQAHKHEIFRKAEASHTIPLHEVRALQKISFLREVKRRLFVITVYCHGHLLYATVQSVPSGKPDTVSLVKASLEVVGHDGRPHAWRGKVRPVYETLSTLWATDQCLTMDPAAIGAFAGAHIILHTKITVYVPGSKK
ncbi:hypothetical protein B7P43_G12393 [Cryptotermes secundus]|uniref:SIAH-type domain-containing protein n=1 Tax=Cryptotermes secundus TaxID=105785 RepID=A0A2J7PRP6_9NEOP|nr:uncharacterized protein LOC111872244 isoform X2 [Cryptotermes secundus]PNF19007.1 hypothetical protein B7P43_G12393 [Cryptotermes secundus]